MIVKESLYVAQAENGYLKVGRSTKPEKRKIGIDQQFRRFGTRLARFHACAPVSDYVWMEHQLITAIAARECALYGREWFVSGNPWPNYKPSSCAMAGKRWSPRLITAQHVSWQQCAKRLHSTVCPIWTLVVRVSMAGTSKTK